MIINKIKIIKVMLTITMMISIIKATVIMIIVMIIMNPLLNKN